MTPTQLAALVRSHDPAFARERRSHATILAYLGWLRHPLDETADPVHVTASAIVLDPAGGSTVLLRHRRLGIWLQPGGHIDPGEDPRDAALRETREETGLAVRHDDPDRLLHVDVHEGGRGHLHLDLRWLLHAQELAFAPAKGESPDVRWVPLGDIDAWGDASIGDAVRAASARLAEDHQRAK